MTNFLAFQELCDRRRSVRYFDAKPISKETLVSLIGAANKAPSVENTQPWHFHVIQDVALKKKMMEMACYGNFVAGASAFIVVSCNKAARPQTQQTIWNPREMEYSCVAAMHQLMLAAAAMDIGSCWVSLHHGPAHDALKLNDHHTVVGGMMLGYMKPDEREPSGTHMRRPLEECYTFY